MSDTEKKNIMDVEIENNDKERAKEMYKANNQNQNQNWITMENKKRLNLSKINKNIISNEVSMSKKDKKETMEIRNETTTVDMSELEREREIYRFVQNSKSIYENSIEEPSMAYYNINNKLLAFILEYEEVKNSDQLDNCPGSKGSSF